MPGTTDHIMGTGIVRSVDEEPDSTESPPLEQLLIHIGRELRESNDHLKMIRQHLGLLVLIGIAGIIGFVLILTGTVTLEFKPTLR